MLLRLGKRADDLRHEVWAVRWVIQNGHPHSSTTASRDRRRRKRTAVEGGAEGSVSKSDVLTVSKEVVRNFRFNVTSFHSIATKSYGAGGKTCFNILAPLAYGVKPLRKNACV